MENSTNFLNNIASKEIKYNLGAGVPPLSLYPKFEPDKLFSFGKEKFDIKSVSYHETSGFIIEAASKVLEVNEDISIDAKKIVITNGVQEAISIAISCFKHNTLVCIEPSYPGFEDAAKAFGCQILRLNKLTWLEDLKQLPEDSLFYLSADFSNPLGLSISLADRLKLISLAIKNKFYIFDDATYRQFNLSKALPSLYSFHSERVIHAISFSKILAPGLRTGFIYLPENLVPKFVSVKSCLSLNNSGITQRIIQEWLKINNYNISAHLSQIKQRLYENQKILNNHNITFNGGFFCTLSLKNSVTFEYCESLLKHENIAVIPMVLFSNNNEYINQMRLCVANISQYELDDVLYKIKKFKI